MDYFSICEREGYRLEDLNEMDAHVVEWVCFVLEQLADKKEFICSSFADTRSEKLDEIMIEIAGAVFDEVMLKAKIEAKKLQICFAELGVK